jgi:ribonucleoside-diphosphate reductase alpha chain
LKQKAGKLEFPEKIENSPSSVQAAFISGYFDADGCAQKSKKVYKMASIDFDFIRKVQDVLMANGIVSRLHFEDRTKLGWKNLYTLAIVGKLAQERFIVFMRESEKVKKSKFVVKRDNVLTPYVSSDFGLTRQSFKYCPSDSQFLSSNTFNRLSNEDGVNIEHEVLIKDSIVSMVELDEKVDTYDLKLEKEHLFWCASFYVHNSGRRGAMMLTINVHHPEVLTFATIKKDLTKVTGANISIFLTDEFLKAVEKGEKYEQRWPVDAKKPKISIMVDAKEVWNKIIETAHLTAEPGLMFIDSIIKDHPASAYADEGFTPHSSNPCSEISMNADTCRLMAINMSSFVENPFTKEAKFDFDKWSEVVYKAQRLMDDMVDLEIEYMGKIIAKIESDPEPEHIKAHEIRTWNEFLDNAIKGRRTGLGVTAIGDAFAYLGVKYGSDESIALMDNIFKTKKLAEYRSSIDLAKERGSFPIYNYEKEKHNAFIKQLIKDGPELDSLLKKHGRRNVCISTIAPTGSVSILTQTTSGIEPVFALSYTRKKKITTNDDAKADYVDQLGDKFQVFTVYHHGVEKWMKISGETDVKKSPYHGSTSYDLNYQQRVKLQAAAQKHIDHAISSTVNLPNNATIEDVSKIYTEAWSSGLKGITVYRDGCRDGILVSEESMSEKKEDKVELLSGNAIRRPKKIPCDIFQITADGEKWTVLVGLVNGKPYEVFCGKPKKVELGKTEKGYIEKEGKGVYSLHIGEDTILKDIGDIFTDTQGAFSRMISTSLRHGVDIQFLVQQLEKSDGTIFSFSKAISRVLKKYIVEGAKESGVKCKDCGSESLVRQEGCVTCKDCGWSKC